MNSCKPEAKNKNFFLRLMTSFVEQKNKYFSPFFGLSHLGCNDFLEPSSYYHSYIMYPMNT